MDAFHSIVSILNELFSPFAAMIVLILFAMCFMLYKENKNGSLSWTDMLVQKFPDGSSSLSLTKMLQMVGGVTSTWMMIYLTLHDKLSTEFLVTYLTYVGAIEGWSKFVAAKYGQTLPDATDPTKDK